MSEAALNAAHQLDREPRPQEAPEAIELEIDWSDEPVPVYANGAQMVHSHREFSIAFTDFAQFAGRRPKPYPVRPGEIQERARVVASVRLTPDVFFQLIAAGADNWNKYAERLAAHGQQLPRFDVQAPGAEPPADG